ncbi:MAG: WD40 repeat domain-containing protein [Aequorivita sp.]
MKLEVKQIAKLTGHRSSIYTLDKGTEEHIILSGSGDKTIAQWNLETFQPKKIVAGFPAVLYSICLIPEKQLLLGGTANGKVHILDLEKNEEVTALSDHTSEVFDIKYSIETNCIYTAGGDGNFAVYSLDTFALIKIENLCDEKVRSLDFYYATSEIAIASGDGNIRIFDLKTLQEKKVFVGHQLSSNVVRFSPNGKLLLSGGRDAQLNVWKVGDYELIKSIPAHEWAIYDIAYSPNSNLFATASRDKTLKIWDSKTFKLLEVIDKEGYDGHQFSVNKLIWSTYNDYLISAGDDRDIIIWEINQDKTL